MLLNLVIKTLIWLAFMAAEIYPIVEIVDYPERFIPEDGDPAALRKIARERIRERILIIERMIEGPFLLSGGFSILDIYAVMFSRWRVAKYWTSVPQSTVMSEIVPPASVVDVAVPATPEAICDCFAASLSCTPFQRIESIDALSVVTE